MPVLAAIARRDRHAERSRYRGRGMGRAKGVVHRLAAAGKARYAACLPQLAHSLASPGQDLVWIGLVTDVPHDPVLRRIEHVMQRDRQLDRAQVGTQMTPGPGDRLEHE